MCFFKIVFGMEVVCNIMGGWAGGGGSRGSGPPFLAHDVGFLTLGPKSSWTPHLFFFLLGDLRWTPPLSRILDPPLNIVLFISNIITCVYFKRYAYRTLRLGIYLSSNICWHIRPVKFNGLPSNQLKIGLAERGW